MKKTAKRFLLLCLIAGTCFLACTFLFGKLFPYSPILIGFSKQEQSNSILYIQNGAHFENQALIEKLVPMIEAFHQMRFKRKPEVVIFKDSSSYIQRSLSSARFCTFYNSRIVIAPWALKDAQTGKISLPIYLNHELSHSLMHQQAGLLRSLSYPKWLLEGIAMVSADQMGTTLYPGKKETYEYIRQGNYMPPMDFRTKKERAVELGVENRIGFMYSEFGCIVDYLIKKYGKESFTVYIRRLLKEKDHNKIFRQIYSIDFREFLINFKTEIVADADKEKS